MLEVFLSSRASEGSVEYRDDVVFVPGQLSCLDNPSDCRRPRIWMITPLILLPRRGCLGVSQGGGWGASQRYVGNSSRSFLSWSLSRVLYTPPHVLTDSMRTPWGLSMNLHGVHEDCVETPWILAGLHPAFPIVHMDSPRSPCGVPVESTWTCGLHGDSSSRVSWTP